MQDSLIQAQIQVLVGAAWHPWVLMRAQIMGVLQALAPQAVCPVQPQHQEYRQEVTALPSGPGLPEPKVLHWPVLNPNLNPPVQSMICNVNEALAVVL